MVRAFSFYNVLLQYLSWLHREKVSRNNINSFIFAKRGVKTLKDKHYKEPAPKEFVPTELGSAVFASVDGRPSDEDYLLEDINRKGDRNGTGDNKNNGE